MEEIKNLEVETEETEATGVPATVEPQETTGLTDTQKALLFIGTAALGAACAALYDKVKGPIAEHHEKRKTKKANDKAKKEARKVLLEKFDKDWDAAHQDEPATEPDEDSSPEEASEE